MKRKIFFLSIDGMTDPLGQSQVIPYLAGLSQKGFEICIISCEKEGNLNKNKGIVGSLLEKHKIRWVYTLYSNAIPFVSQTLNVKRLQNLAGVEIRHLTEKPLLHCRSYLAALAGLNLKKKYGARFLFDMRGFWADERVDGKIWRLGNPLHWLAYRYFKRKEKQMLQGADCIVTLTREAKGIINAWLPGMQTRIEVIPCCVDLSHFTIQSDSEKNSTRQLAGIPPSNYVVGYLGSLGTWYMLDEMLAFFSELLKTRKDATFFFITPDEPSGIYEAARKFKIPDSAVVVMPAKRNEVPALIATLDIGLFFIKPLFSKKGSSPTKLGELLACGIPVISNSGIGDCDKLFEETGCGVLVSAFDVPNYQKAIVQAEKMAEKDATFFRKLAEQEFSLEKGILCYEALYNSDVLS